MLTSHIASKIIKFKTKYPKNIWKMKIYVSITSLSNKIVYSAFCTYDITISKYKITIRSSILKQLEKRFATMNFFQLI